MIIDGYYSLCAFSYHKNLLVYILTRNENEYVFIIKSKNNK